MLNVKLIIIIGDLKEIKRNKNFRLIACMNPGTDIGKKELPENIRVKFTEFFVNDLEDRSDLLYLIDKVLNAQFTHDVKEKLVDFYLWLRRSSDNYELEVNSTTIILANILGWLQQETSFLIEKHLSCNELYE